MKESYQAESPSSLPCESAPVLSPQDNAPRPETVKNSRLPVPADRKDQIFALLYFAVGYGFIYSLSSSLLEQHMIERHLAVFTAAYAAVVLSYLLCRGIRPAKESYFWLAVLLGIGIPYAFWTVMPVLQMLALMAVAAYWTLSASGQLMEQEKTSSFILCDLFHALVLIPFSNFLCQFTVLGGGFPKEKSPEDLKKNPKHHFSSVLLGIFTALPILAVILPLLIQADAGFETLLQGGRFFLQEQLLTVLVRLLFSIPVSLYLFGLAYGSIHKRNTGQLKAENIRQTGKNIRLFPDTAVCTTLTIVCLVYLLFVGLQGKYLFSAFTGAMPGGFTYAEYARRGFFELCAIAALNLLLLLWANLFSKNDILKNKSLMIFNILLSILTLLLITTAISKMCMYIAYFGLTVRRILTMVFMLWMTIVFISVILRQKKVFPLIRICTICGAILFTLLCLIPVEACIQAVNASMF